MIKSNFLIFDFNVEKKRKKSNIIKFLMKLSIFKLFSLYIEKGKVK